MKNKSVSLVFWVSLVICTIFVAFGAIFPKQLEKLTQNITTFIALHFSWYYLLLVLVILFVCVYILFSRYANITLGEEGEDPEFSLPSWFAMLFSAGMGIGLVFWTTAEPISHAFKLTPIHKAGTQSAINDAMQFSFFHWGIHAWAVYGIVALVFAYFSFHKGYPGLVSATLTPLLGEKAMRGPLGGAIDVLAVIATVTGVAATLGFGALQINEGLHFLFNVPMSLRIPSGGQKFQWLQNWTIFYWAWWISWAPFVGIFIARVSKGRTIKEFILGVLFVPALVCFIFFAVFGASAIYLQDNHIADIAKAATETATFATLQHYPLGFVLSLITLLVIMIFFVTSADSATYVLGMLSSRGDINPKSFVKVSWGIIMALFAIIMIYTGGTQAIQNLLIIAALPFSVVIIAMIWSLLKSLSEEKPRNSNKVLIKHRDPDILEYRSSKHIDEN
ncbi:TPA: BCCT family transporter [Staphylococcus aureus]